jgi:cysteine-rich repeat protein
MLAACSSGATDDVAGESEEGGAGGAAADGGGSDGPKLAFDVSGDAAVPHDAFSGTWAAPGNDTCAGAIELFQSPTDHSLDGTLAEAVDDTTTFCADPVGSAGLREVFYTATLTSECAATFTLTGGPGFNGALSLRSDCTVDEVCVYHDGAVDQLFAASLPAGQYWIVVTGAADSSDEFTLTSYCDAPECGDGLVSAGEQCDDGDIVDGDGCDATCHFEAAASEEHTCAAAMSGSAIDIDFGLAMDIPSSQASFSASTVGASDNGTGSCMTASVDPAPDHVYHFHAVSSGTLTATLGLSADGTEPACGLDPALDPDMPYAAGCYDRALHVREADCGAGVEVACSDDPVRWWMPETVSFSVTADTDYYVFVDGYNDDPWGSGPYMLQVQLVP